MVGFSPDNSISRTPKVVKNLENKEQLNEGLKLTYLATNKAFFVDAAGKPWYLDIDKNDFKEADIMDTYPMNVQFDTALPMHKTEFKNKEEAFLYVKMEVFKDHIRSGVKDMKWELSHAVYSKELIADVKLLLEDYEMIEKILDTAAKETDLIKREELEKQAYDVYLEKNFEHPE